MQWRSVDEKSWDGSYQEVLKIIFPLKVSQRFFSSSVTVSPSGEANCLEQFVPNLTIAICDGNKEEKENKAIFQTRFKTSN